MIYYAIADIWSAFKEFNNDALLFGLAAAFIYSAAIIIRHIYRRVKGRPFSPLYKIFYKLIVFTAIGIYTSYTISLTLSGREAGSRSTINLIPGTTLFNGSGLALSAIENLVLFVPLGILLPMLWSYYRSVLTTSMASFVVSLAIELTQLITQRGYFETDDIIINTFGGVVGYLIFAYCYDSALSIRLRILKDNTPKGKSFTLPGKAYDRTFVKNDFASILFQIVPVGLCADMIMGFSKDTGTVSSGWSRPIAFIVAKVGSLFPGMNVDITSMSLKELEELVAQQNLILDLVEKVIRKFAHVTEYALLALAVWILIFSRPYIKKIFSYWGALAAVAAVGMLDELNQSLVEGRTGTIKDVGIDLIGAVLVVIIAALTVRIIQKHMAKKAEKEEMLFETKHVGNLPEE